MGPRRSMRLNATISGVAPPPRVSTTGTTAVATSVATRGEVQGAFTTVRAVPSKATHGTKAMTQASLSHASRTKQPTLVAQLTPTKQHAPVKQLAPVVSQAAQVGSRPSRPIIESGAFSPHFSTDLTFPNSNLVPEAYHHSTAQEGTFHRISPAMLWQAAT
ncbi:hypothetical protein ACFX1X_043897 [Malus domestica]